MNLFELMVKIGVDDNASKKIANISSKLGKGLKTAAKVGAKAVTAATAAVGAFAAASVKAGMSFDSSMSQVAATMGKTVDEITDLRDFAQEMGAKTAFSATQAADALNYMALAGYSANQSMEMLPNVLNLAAAGGMDLARASDMITDSQTALGISFEQTAVMVDQMAKASSTTNTSVEQLGDAILSIGGTAKNLSGGTKELNAVLGVMADNGIKASEAGIHLRNIMLAMNPQTDAAAAAFEQLGLEAYDSEGKLRSIDSIFGDLSKSLDGMTDQQKTEALSAIFNKTDLTTVNALLSTSQERWDQVYDAIENAGGAAQKMADTQLDNLEGDITLFKSALEGAQITISDSLTPTLRGFVKFGSKALSELSEGFKEGGLTGAMDALGELLSEGLAMIIEQLPTMVEAGASLLISLVEGILQNAGLILNAAVDLILRLATGISESLPTLIPAVIDAILLIVHTLTSPEMLSKLLDAALLLITELAYGLMDAIPALVDATITIIENLILFLCDPENLAKLIGAAIEIILALGVGIVKSIPRFLEYFYLLPIKIIKALFETDWGQVGKNIIDGLWNGLKNAWNSLVKWFSNAWDSLVGGVLDFLGIHSPSRLFAGIGKNMALGVGEGWEKTFAGVEKDINSSFDFGGALGEFAYGNYGDGMANPGYGGISVVQNIYSEAKTAADLMEEAMYQQEKAVYLGV